jgi:hypothetical protein
MKEVIALLSVFIFSTELIAQKNIFNEKDLKGWEVYGTEKWFVENGELVCESGPDKAYGYLATKKRYKNFELTLEFRQEANGNSGVFIHSSIVGTKITGWQAEVAPLANKTTDGIYESYGRGWLIKPDTSKANLLKEGQWNEMKVLVHGDKITTWLNGYEMISLSDARISESEGQIALQIHDGGGVRVRWRNIRIKEM